MLYAFCCSCVSFIFSLLLSTLCIKGFLSICFFSISTYPFFARLSITTFVISVNISISDINAPSLSIKNFNTLICLFDVIFLFSISFSISSLSFFNITYNCFFSFILFDNIFVLVPGGNISFKQSDMLQKYLFAIHLANSIFSLFIHSSCTFAISFTLYSEFSFMPITNPSSRVFTLPNGTKTLLPTFILSSKFVGIL